VRVIQRRDGPRLLLETGTMAALQLFDGDNAVQSGIAGLVDLTHAALADRRDDLVGPELFPYSERHG
jgi:hypothetical protein